MIESLRISEQVERAKKQYVSVEPACIKTSPCKWRRRN